VIGAIAMILDLLVAGAFAGRLSTVAQETRKSIPDRAAVKLDRPKRSAAVLAARGIILAFGMVGLGASLGIVVDAFVRDLPYGWALEIVLLAALLGQRTAWPLLRSRLEEGADDVHKARQAVVAELAELLAMRLIGVLFWHALFGFAGALAFRFIMSVPTENRSKAFREPIEGIKQISLVVPNAIAALIVPLACIFSPRGAPIMALRSMMASPSIAAARGLFAGGLNLTLAGPKGWLGPSSGRARLQAQDVASATVLYGAGWACVLLLNVIAEGALLYL